MATLPPEDLLPILVADLADDDAIEILDAAASDGCQIFVPLETAPVNASMHMLEVHLPSMAEPLFYLALPLGPPTEDGFPMRIQPMPDAKPSGAVASIPPGSRGVVRSRRATTSMTLSASHTADLSQMAFLPSAPEDTVIGRALAGGKLVMEALIGRGGVGAVYKARHRELRLSVAVKVLHESFQHDIDFCRRFYAEALAASRLDHPNITRVIDFGQEPDGLLYLAMEFLAGVELRAVLTKEGPLRASRIAEVMMQTCAGLSQAHARGIVHRDIKPENLVIVPGHDDDGEPIEVVKVCDFGIAQHRALVSAEEAGIVAGTPEYMSPEQCRGDALDARSDIYACGVVLYELATGQVPFTSERPQSLLNKHQFTEPTAPSAVFPGVDPRLERIILRALSKEPEDRPQTMRELRTELRELLPQGGSAKDSSAHRAMPRTARSAYDEPVETPAPSAASSSASRATPSSPRSAPREPSASPAWLERGPVYATSAYSTSLPSVDDARIAIVAPKDEAADVLEHATEAWLRHLDQTREPGAFTRSAQSVESLLRALVAAGEMQTLRMVSTAMRAVSTESTQVVGSRAHTSATLLRVLDDPAVLLGVAEHLLKGSESARDHARHLLIDAGVAGAYGLYGARVKFASEATTRGAFTVALKEFGAKAWPVVRAALEKIISQDQSQNPRTMELAEDLLLCVPVVGDESAGHLVVRYLRVDVAGVCRAATASIVTLWGDRAKPLLVGMLQSKDDVVRIAGIAGLRQLDGIDEHVVSRLQAILLRRLPAGEEVRAAAAVVLGHVQPTARQPAISLLVQLVTPQRDGLVAVRVSPEHSPPFSREDAVTVASARALLVLGGLTYRGLVAERAKRSHEALRAQLTKLLA